MTPKILCAMLITVFSLALYGNPAMAGNTSNHEALPLLGGAMKNFDLNLTSKDAPDPQFYGPDGPVIMSDFLGKVVLVNFWATWCAPCVVEMPSLNELQKQLGGRKFKVVAISIDRAGEAKARPFLEQRGIDRLTVFTDPKGQSARAFGVSAMPTSILLDKDGTEIGRFLGATEWHAISSIEFIKHFIYRNPAVVPAAFTPN